MIGIGILTWRRGQYMRDVILPSIIKHTVSDFELAISCNGWDVAVSTDIAHNIHMLGSGKNLGVAGGKNRIICWFLSHPELTHLFLFEDDCEPIKRGWDEWFLEGHRSTKVEAVTAQQIDFYGGITSHGPRSSTHEAVGTYVDGMTLLSCTRKAVETIGGFHRAFEGINGQEHSEWMVRANRAALCPFTNTTFAGNEEWIDGIDYREWRHGKGLPGGVVRPAGDPATARVFGANVYDRGRETFFRTKKTHKIGGLYQDPCWNEASAQEVVGP